MDSPAMKHQSKHILIADDELNLTNSLKFVLNAAGYRTSTAANGRDAFAIIQNGALGHCAVDLLVTDIAMPVMNGEELITELRRQSIQIPILVFTGYGCKDLVVRLMRLGCQDFIDKPFEPVEIEDRVKMILTKTNEEMLEIKRKEHFARIGEKSRSIIHDLNNILGGTLGYADMALEDVDKSHPVHAKIEKLFKTANLAADFCKRLLTLKPDAPVVLKVNTEIRSLVDKIAVVLQTLAPDTIEIRTETPDNPIWLKADAELIQQALLNLGINALDAMGERGALTFSTAFGNCRGENGITQSCVSITVSDTGCGIPEENIDKLFTEEFTTKRSGNGIGLPTVKRIVDEHQGQITVESRPGEGTRFRLFFPMPK